MSRYRHKHSGVRQDLAQADRIYALLDGLNKPAAPAQTEPAEKPIQKPASEQPVNPIQHYYLGRHVLTPDLEAQSALTAHLRQLLLLRQHIGSLTVKVHQPPLWVSLTPFHKDTKPATADRCAAATATRRSRRITRGV